MLEMFEQDASVCSGMDCPLWDCITCGKNPENHSHRPEVLEILQTEWVSIYDQSPVLVEDRPSIEEVQYWVPREIDCIILGWKSADWFFARKHC